MKTFKCPDCGALFNENAVPNECTKCGCSKEFFTEELKYENQENISPSLESSNNFSAEHVANGLAGLTLGIGVIIGVIGLIAGIVFCTQEFGPAELIGLPIIAFSLIWFIICLLSWAFLRLFVNISYRLTRIDNKTKAE